jgi:hypothetical protein
MLCYMPTLGLSNTVAFTNIKDRNEFPALRVWGTIGWIVAGLVVGGLGMSSSPKIFTMAGAAGVLLGLLCFALPKTPPPSRDKPINIGTLFMVDALKLMTSIPFFVFIICSALVCIPLAYYYAYTAVYLPQIGFQATASTMALGQISEIFFMLLVPFFFRKLGGQDHDPGRHACMGRALRALCHGSSRSSGLDDARWSDPSWHLLRLLFRHRFHVHG